MDEEIKSLKARRGISKSKITRFATFVDGFNETQSLEELQTRIEKIDIIFDEFDNIQTALETKDTPSSVETHREERKTFENNFYTAVGKAKKIISNHKNQQQLSNVVQSPSLVPQTPIRVAKLPQINIPEFDGSCENWAQFCDMFKALVHNDVSMSNTQKFYYLKGCLKSHAADIIQNLNVTNDNYPIAWDLLCKRYENKRIIVNHHLKSLFDMPCISKESKVNLRTILDDLQRNIRSLTALGQPTENWDAMIIYLVTSKLDFYTRKEWEQCVTSNEGNSDFPSYNEFISFLTKKCQLLETLDSQSSSLKSTNNTGNNQTFKKFDKKTFKKNESFSHLSTSKHISCYFCKGNHFIFSCKDFLKLTPKVRESEIRKLRLCINCFKSDHSNANQCPSGKCKLCSGAHNTLIHQDQPTAAISGNIQSQQKSSAMHTVTKCEENSVVHGNNSTNNVPSNTSLVGHCTSASRMQANQIILPTANVLIENAQGYKLQCRAILDSGSMSNFMTSSLCKVLGYNLRNSSTPVAGVSGFSIAIRGTINTTIYSIHDSFKSSVDFLVTDKITGKLPEIPFSLENLKLPENVQLADSACNNSSNIDILLGADIFFRLLGANKVELGPGQPFLQETRLGWVVSGSLGLYNDKEISSFCNLSTTNNIQELLERFWRLEECDTTKMQSLNEQECEQHFTETTRRDDTGRFVVMLPLKDNVSQLGDSYNSALKRFYSLEKRLNKDKELKILYDEFMSEYIELNHMSLVPTNEINVSNQYCYYMPHHGVLKPTSTTTKLRTVFDASMPTDTGLSLNNVLKIGPTVQNDLFSILVRFRKHNYVIMADIAKMYRQVSLDSSHRDLQRIIWRFNATDALQIYRLNTVVYGQASSSFLAIRCLFEIGIENEQKHPKASNAIKNDFYCDDLISGSDSIQSTIQLKNCISKLLQDAQFPLRKWTSNSKAVLKDAPNDIFQYIINDETNLKALGILWDSNLDTLGFTVNFDEQLPIRITKRIILSVICKLFDPLGLAGPVIIQAKILLQDLWKLNLNWDQGVPRDIENAFRLFYSQLVLLKDLRVSRQAILKNSIKIEMHGFCDSSEKAYCACVYLRSTDDFGNINVRLLCAKARVAPLKSQTLPRLELLGCVVLAKLANKTIKALAADIFRVVYWTDSTIVLAWLASEPSKWKRFVANRVAEVQSLSNISQWRHILSGDNPADIISRGATPRDLIERGLWWNGPEWLSLPDENWPRLENQDTLTDLPEKRKISEISLTTTVNMELFTKFSSLTKLQRVLAYCLRFIKNCRYNKAKLTGKLLTDEYENSLHKLVKIAQAQMFPQEVYDLEHTKYISRNSKLLSLNPFLDSLGLLRVGGRIRNADVPYSQKHPLLLSDKHNLSKLIISYEHLRHFHSGPQATLAAIRCKFWILNGRNAVRAITRSCITCFKANPTPNVRYQMADLPNFRVNPARAFLNSGVDLAGPFFIKDGKLRNRRIIKCYLCVFVCLVTRAVHLEVCSDLSSPTFLAAFKRFISRRGISKLLYSDNGSNFVGASRELREIRKSFGVLSKDSYVLKYLQENNISWSFIPPRAPHFGGLWEAAVKSAKYHLKRVAANANLTFELFYTLVVEIEAVLNSRPLIPLSSDPHDLEFLSPAHFLIGSTLTAPPEYNYTEIPINRLTQYQRLQKMFQQFWLRWKSEYLNHMQERNKWQFFSGKTVLPGTMVILKEDNMLPLVGLYQLILATIIKSELLAFKPRVA